MAPSDVMTTAAAAAAQEATPLLPPVSSFPKKDRSNGNDTDNDDDNNNTRNKHSPFYGTHAMSLQDDDNEHDVLRSSATSNNSSNNNNNRSKSIHDDDNVPLPSNNNNNIDTTPNSHQGTTTLLYHYKTQGPSFFHDLRHFRPGSLPHSMVLATCIGVLCGIAAYLYYAGLEYMLQKLWHDWPIQYWLGDSSTSADETNNDDKSSGSSSSTMLQVLWIPLVGFSMATGVGLTVQFLGEPGDLPYTIKCVHEKAYVAMDHVLPMVVASQFSIVAGGSLGPEAPLVAICAALGGFVSRHLFHVTNRNLVRKHTLMGMAGALAAFFGCPLGGSLFAMEVNSRFGIEYFEHTLEAVFCGEVCLAVFRWLANMPIESIWTLADMKLAAANSSHVLFGAVLGLVGAGIAAAFAKLHWAVLAWFGRYNLLVKERAVARAMLGAIVVVLLGMLVPHTMFWGEFEIQTIATMSPASTLEHIWPTRGLIGFEMDSFGTALIVGVAKLVAISFTVCGGYRGGYIFPAFAAGMAFGRAIYFICPFIPVQLCCLCMAAALNVALTRTAIATTLILAFLSGEQNAITAILAASLMSLFITGYMPFIPSQIVRNDTEVAIFYSQEHPEVDDAASLRTNRSVISSMVNRVISVRSGGVDEDNENDDDDPLNITPFQWARKTPNTNGGKARNANIPAVVAEESPGTVTQLEV